MSANVAVEGAKMRFMDLAKERGATNAGAERILSYADLGDLSEAHLRKEAARLVEIAEPTDLIMGEGKIWMRALRMRILEERKLNADDPDDLRRRVNQRMNQASELQSRLGKMWRT